MLEKGAYVEGRVLDADGDPVPGALVLSTDRPDTLFGFLRNSVTIKGDIITPILPIGRHK